ncbi:PREDICTED: leupaxin [Pygoscelis adeliae]|uniref:leupaxin n=1 Tax=Pygoscelis adeliae TaxID=9238 RepID=UPI0004F4DE60|nr:PREDICTED: leupaxin [Pygoscelis adeliae]
MEDLDALLAELEQSSHPGSKDCMLQVPSSCKQDLATAGPPAPSGHERLASAALKVQLPPQAQPPGEALKTVYRSFLFSQMLGRQPFCERGGRAYCEEDYHQAFSPRCAYCANPIREKVLTALDQTWHPEHFFCAHCGKVFGDDGFHERSGKPYCRQDFLAMFAPKCQGCERPVMDNYLSALQGVWHPECFVCAECLNGFAIGSFFELEGRPYCELK